MGRLEFIKIQVAGLGFGHGLGLGDDRVIQGQSLGERNLYLPNKPKVTIIHHRHSVISLPLCLDVL